jgi:hypothetical protein
MYAHTASTVTLAVLWGNDCWCQAAEAEIAGQQHGVRRLSLQVLCLGDVIVEAFSLLMHLVCFRPFIDGCP